MSHSTPHRPSGGKQTSRNHFNNTPPTSQDELKAGMPEELQDAIWQLDATRLARALSAKSRKKDAPPLTIDSMDSLDHYNITLDEMDDVLERAVESLQPSDLIPATREADHYDPLVVFLNSCLATCRRAAGVDASHYYSDLNFIVWDNPTKDGVRGAHALKPDCVGAQSLRDIPSALWWRPPSGERSSTVEIPVEVKDGWWGLVSQAATYARCLTNAVPLRQFSLVIGYNHVTTELRFLFFHAGGLTSSPPLKPNDPQDHRAILRLFLSLLTWKSRGDAGLPEWCNDVDVFVQRSRDDKQGVQMRVKEVYYDRLGVRGRGGKVVRLSPIPRPAPSHLPIAPPAPRLQILRRSRRIADKQTKENIPSKRASKSSSKQYCQPAVLAKKLEKGSSEPYHMPIAVHRGAFAARFVPQQLDYFSKSIDADAGDLVSKVAWVGSLYASVESRMFEDCGGMFGVMPFYNSSIVRHKENLPATNHLFLGHATFWDLYTSASDHTPDLRVLVRHLSEYVGDLLSSVSKPQELFVAIAHAALGYRNFIEQGFHHRDISMGNILWSKDAKQTKSALEEFGGELSGTQERLRSQLAQSGVRDRCHGFVIDGDLAVELKSYFSEDRKGTRSRSGTDEYMSDQLLDAAILDKPYLQSPVDDLISFYYVAQWAAVNNTRDFPDPTAVSDELRLLRQRLGSSSERERGTSMITSGVIRPALYGKFLADCRPILQEWRQKLVTLTNDWAEAIESVAPDVEDQYKTYYPLFCEFTDRGVLEVLELVQLHFAGHLHGSA